ncbi:MAG: hypothetical protein ACE5IO_03450, partial [Thermoplasmata archaeon]
RGGSMPSKKRIAITLITVIALVSGIGLVGLPMWHALQFRWGVEEGNQFTYDVHVFGYEEHYDANGSYYEPPPYASFNNSVITVNITFLPDIPILLTPDAYVEHVIIIEKVTAVASSNMTGTETEIAERYRVLSSLISCCLTPVGGWTILDSFYPNRPVASWTLDTYLSSLESNEFFIGHHYHSCDAADGWSGSISLDTGMPDSVTFWSYDLSGGPIIYYSITLTLR